MCCQVGYRPFIRSLNLANLWTVCCIVEMVYLYPKFIHDVSKNAAPLNRLLKGRFFFFFSPRLPNEHQLPVLLVQTPVWEVPVSKVVSNMSRETPISTCMKKVPCSSK